MIRSTARFAALISSTLLSTLVVAPVAMAQDASEAPRLDADTINAAQLDAIADEFVVPATSPQPGGNPDAAPVEDAKPKLPDPAMAKLQILLDRAGVSPGVIDGFEGDNVRKAVMALELRSGLPVDGTIDADLIAQLNTNEPVIGSYVIEDQDLENVTGEVPADYADKAKLDLLGYADGAEAIAEKFHMDVDFLKALNPGADFSAGESINVAAYGPDLMGKVARIEADKSLRQVRAYGEDNRLIAAYPATIGSEDNPSPSGTHTVEVVVNMPDYTYNPDVNFKQGDNDKVLQIPPGPNGPVGSVWIDLSEPTFGIHGTPEPSLIDKVGSHGCVRLTNWDAQELGAMVEKGVTVEFLG